jgi:transposase
MMGSIMTIKVRTLMDAEREALMHWQRSDSVVRYRRARILFLSEEDWKCPEIADVLGIHAETVRDTIQRFNEGGVEAINPRPRSGGSQRGKLSEEMRSQVEESIHAGPPAEQKRATWSLASLAEQIATDFETVKSVSRETVRRFLLALKIKYRKAKGWLTSPDPLYTLRKYQRDRLLKLARNDPDGAAVWLDESWFVKWPYSYWGWSLPDEQPTYRQRWNEDVEKVALFASLDDESQTSFIHWATGQPNSDRMIDFLQALAQHWTTQGKRYIALFWDKASWHTSHKTRDWLSTYNRTAKKQGLCRILVCYHPTRSPWLMPLEAIFGAIKHRILGNLDFEALATLKSVVEHYFQQRVPEAKARRDITWLKFEKSRSVL